MDTALDSPQGGVHSCKQSDNDIETIERYPTMLDEMIGAFAVTLELRKILGRNLKTEDEITQ